MQENENTQQPENSGSEPTTNAGGTAPAERRCCYTKADGRACRDWALRGHEHCFRHHRYLHARPERPIEVPLLEDAASIVLLLSETMRAIAWGTIPVSNGRLLLAGCKLAHAMQRQRHEEAKLRMRCRRMDIPEEEIFEGRAAKESQETGASQESEAGSEEPGAGSLEAVAELAPNPEVSNAPLATPNPRVRFRNLKQNWDKELGRAANEMMDMRFPRHDETREAFEIARDTPFGG